MITIGANIFGTIYVTHGNKSFMVEEGGVIMTNKTYRAYPRRGYGGVD